MIKKDKIDLQQPVMVGSHDVKLDADYAEWINLWYMKQWYLFYTENMEKLKQLVSEIKHVISDAF